MFEPARLLLLCNRSLDETPSRELKMRRSIFDQFRRVSSGDETLCRMLGITSQAGEINDTK